MLCVTPDSLSALDEAEIRVAWGAGATTFDQALVRLLKAAHTNEATEEDFTVLVRNKNLFEAELEMPSNPILSHELRTLARKSIQQSSTQQSPMQQSYEESTSNVVDKEEQTNLKEWYKQKASKRKTTWLGIRFSAEESISGSWGLYKQTGWYILTGELRDSFDEVGVLKYPEDDSE